MRHFSMTVAGDSLSELRANLQAAADALLNADQVVEATAPAPKKKPAPVADEDEAPAKPAKKKAAPVEDDDDEAIDYETKVRPVIVKFIKDFSREDCAEVLEQFTNPSTDEPATKGQEVDPSDYAKLLSKLAKARAKLADA